MASHWLNGPVLFLDIDGVLNSLEFAKRIAPYKPPGVLGVDPLAVAHLQRVLDETGCSIVLSSTWRIGNMLADIRGMLIAAGAKHPVPLRDKTPWFHDVPRGMGRGKEIDAWINNTGFSGPYVCLDDDSDFLPHQPLVQTSYRHGMLAEHADACISILNERVTS